MFFKQEKHPLKVMQMLIKESLEEKTISMEIIPRRMAAVLLGGLGMVNPEMRIECLELLENGLENLDNKQFEDFSDLISHALERTSDEREI